MRLFLLPDGLSQVRGLKKVTDYARVHAKAKSFFQVIET